ncbi:MAG: hypothetical protein SH859_10565 [Hyphomicrobium aestuarii]|nr:hypothetical protein [Hyphomicrobium aestuarii]
MTTARSILILGASYGSLLGTKLAAAGHHVTLVCLAAEAALIKQDGCRVRLPVRGREGLIEIHSKALPGSLTAATPGEVDPSTFDLVGLAMQEPQYRAPEIKTLLLAIGRSARPCMSIMNMPPLTYLRRIKSLDADGLRHCYSDADVWDLLQPGQITLCSPDPQAFRPATEPVNVLQVRLATNFKAASFAGTADNALLNEMANGVDAYRHRLGSEEIDLPVKLRVHDSLFVPMAKWAMLLAGNYQCVKPDRVASIYEAVHGDLAQSRAIYDDVRRVCLALGAVESDLVPFEKYANAALSLGSPSSVARALDAGATAVERVDLLVQAVSRQVGQPSSMVDQIVANVEAWLARNRLRQASSS